MKNIVLTISACLLLVSCGSKSNPLAEKKKQLSESKAELKELQVKIAGLESEIGKLDKGFKSEQRKKLVKIDTLHASQFSHFIEVQGTVDAEENVLAINQIPGIVTSISVKPGDRVSKGQILATTESSAYERGIEALQTQYALASTAFEKQKRLWDQNIGSEIQYLQARTQKDALEKQIRGQQSQLEMTKIKSPINGVVDEVRLKLGDMAAPSAAMPGIRVISADKLTLKATLSDNYLGRVRKGDKVTVFFPDINKTQESIVSYVGNVVNQSNRTFNLEVSINNKNKDLAANMLAKLLINDAVLKNVIVVPSNIVQRSVDGIYVIVEENGKAVKKTVETGVDYNGQTVITKGLNAGDKIIVFGFSDLVDGQPIEF
jgi:membrane fusion protein (multidrug efflux system)